MPLPRRAAQDLDGRKPEEFERIHPGIRERWQPESDEPQIHRRLADWYGKVLDSSPAPSAVFEVVYHLCRAAATGFNHGARLDPQTDALGWATDKVVAARAMLRTHRFLIQTRGYSRESCRRLIHIRDTLYLPIVSRATAVEPQDDGRLQSKVQDLRVTCTEIIPTIPRGGRRQQGISTAARMGAACRPALG